MDMKALAKAAAARGRRINGMDDGDVQPSPQVTAKKKPLAIPKQSAANTKAARNAAAAAIAGKLGNIGGRGPPPGRGGGGGPPPPSSSSSSGGGGGGGALSDSDEAIAQKYRKMMKIGMPPPAVRHKMAGDGVPAHIVNAVLSGDAPPAPRKPAGGGGGGSSGGGGGASLPPLSDADEAIAQKYRKLMKVGLPPPAIRHKMTGDGVAAHIINAVIAGGADPPPRKPPGGGGGGGGSGRGGGGGAAISTLTQHEEAIAAPFRKMINIGLPPGAVRQKMQLDGGVSEKIMKSVLAGEIPAPEGSTAAPSVAPPQSAGPPGGAGGGHPLGTHKKKRIYFFTRRILQYSVQPKLRAQKKIKRKLQLLIFDFSFTMLFYSSRSI